MLNELRIEKFSYVTPKRRGMMDINKSIKKWQRLTEGITNLEIVIFGPFGVDL